MKIGEFVNKNFTLLFLLLCMSDSGMSQLFIIVHNFLL